jgi:CheY-like chemotaxis protein/FtsZ-binding cell division protein ZapB
MSKILLVDDVDLFVQLEKSFLEDSGHQIATASSGEEALSRLDEVQPELMLLDLYMPGINGDEVCRRLRALGRWQELPVIMVTAAGKDEEILKCLEAGCDDYLTKPVNKKDLIDKVQRLLGRSRVRKTLRASVSLPVQVTHGRKTLETRACDLSENGIFLQSTDLFPQGSPVELGVTFPDGRHLSLRGKVVRVVEGSEGGMGIYFVHPDPEWLLALRHLVATDPHAAPVSPTLSGRPVEVRLEHLEHQNQRAREENRLLQLRITELEEENQDFAGQLIHTEEVNNNLTNLYIASTRLHSQLNRTQVIAIIKEVVINFIGAEKFALLLFDREARQLCYETGEGFEDRPFPRVTAGEGLLGEVAAGGESYFQEGSVSEGSDDPRVPLAAIPLMIHGESMGVLAIYRLFIQKESFQQVDFQLFSMMAEHAATALFSSTLYEESERKRQTYRGFMDLILK